MAEEIVCKGRKEGCLNCMGHDMPPCGVPRMAVKMVAYTTKEGHVLPFKREVTVMVDCKDVLYRKAKELK